jgi:Pyruvate/2-oxoacid:ferredoxin oxidoreductase delta subunit
MDQAFKCRICKCVMPHQVVKVNDDMPPDTAVMECMGCGVLGVMRWRQDLDA